MNLGEAQGNRPFAEKKVPCPDVQRTPPSTLASKSRSSQAQQTGDRDRGGAAGWVDPIRAPPGLSVLSKWGSGDQRSVQPPALAGWLQNSRFPRRLLLPERRTTHQPGLAPVWRKMPSCFFPAIHERER